MYLYIYFERLAGPGWIKSRPQLCIGHLAHSWQNIIYDLLENVMFLSCEYGPGADGRDTWTREPRGLDVVYHVYHVYQSVWINVYIYIYIYNIPAMSQVGYTLGQLCHIQLTIMDYTLPAMSQVGYTQLWAQLFLNLSCKPHINRYIDNRNVVFGSPREEKNK